MKKNRKRFFFSLIVFTCILNHFNLFSEDYYWVKGSGNWSELNHWATSSGGSVFYSAVPGANDNVIFDNNSFVDNGNEVNINVESAICANLNFTGLTKSLTIKGSGDLHIHENLEISLLVNFEFDGNISFEAKNKKYTLVTLNKSFPGSFTFVGNESEWTINGELNCGKSLFLKSNSSLFNFGSLNIGSSFDISSSNTNIVISGATKIVKDFLLYGSQSVVKATGDMQVSGSFSSSTNNGNFSIQGNLSVQNDLILTYGKFKINNYNLIATNIFLYLYSEVDISNSNLNLFHKLEIYGQDVLIASTNTSLNFSGSDLLLESSIPVNFKNVNFNSEGKVSCSNSTIQNLTFKENGTILGEQNLFVSATFTKNGVFNGNNNFTNLNLSPGFEYQFQSTKVQTISNNLNAIGNCQVFIIMMSDLEGTQAIISKSSGTVNLDYLIAKDMNFIGGANFVTTNYVNLQNTTGLAGTLAVPRNLFWVGGTGNWSDPAHWSNSSGGAGGECIPTPVDNVSFDANSFTLTQQQVVIDAEQAFCNNFDWRTATNNPVLINGSTNISLHIYGSLWFSPLMGNSLGSKIIFQSKNTNQEIKSAGKSFIKDLYFEGEGGWVLIDDLSAPANDIYLNKGTLSSGGKKMTMNNFFANANTLYDRSLNINNSEIYLNGDWTVNSAKFGLSTINSHIFMQKTDAIIEAGSNLSYNNISFTSIASSSALIKGSQLTINQLHFLSKGDCSISSSNVQKIIFDNDGILENGNNVYQNAQFNSNGLFLNDNTFGTLVLTPPNSYTFANGKTQTINVNLNASGNCNAPIYMQSDKAGSTANIKKNNSDLILDYIVIRDIKAISGVNYTINDATDLGNNPGWTINKVVAKNYFWIDGSGNWEDPLHWSFSSGGPGGASGTCLPTQNDNVIFDKLSFSSNGQNVTINSESVNCKNMDWSAIDDSPIFTGNAGSMINVFGSLSLSSNLNWSIQSPVSFKGANDNFTINLAGITLLNNIFFDGTGATWQLLSDFSTYGTLSLIQGNVVGNNIAFRISNFTSLSENNPHLNCNNSNILVSEKWNTGLNFNFDGQNSKITLLNDLASFSNKSNYQVNFDEIEMKGFKTKFLSNISSVKKLTISNGIIDGTNTEIDSLIFNSEAEISGNLSVKNGELKSKAYIYSNHKFGKMNFRGNTSIYLDNVFENAKFYGDATITGNNIFDTLLFSPDHRYYLGNYRTQTINKFLSLKGNNCYKIDIRALTKGATANISMASGNVEGYALSIQGIGATGGAKFYAAGPSIDLGDNFGWIFGTPKGYIYGFDPDSIYLDGQVARISTDKFNTNENTTFKWSNGNTSSGILTSEPLNIGIEVIYYSDPAHCSFTDEMNIHFASVKNPTCKTFTDGEIAIKSDKNRNYSYLWDNGNTTKSINNLKAGDYSVTVTDNISGEKAFRKFTLKDPETLNAVFSKLKQPSCIGANNGELSLNIIGGNKPYNISWSDNVSITDSSRTNLKVGTYKVLIKDFGNCENVSLLADMKDPEVLSAKIQKIQGITCTGNSDAKLTYSATGGTKPYLCNWNTGTTADTINNLPIGKYFVKINDANNCAFIYDTILIESYKNLNYTYRTKNQVCYGMKTGEIELFMKGGTEPYMYKWNHTNINSSKLDSLLPGEYSVSISDRFKCETISQSFEILAGKEIQHVKTDLKEPLCYNDKSGEINLEYKGGNGNLKYKIDKGIFQSNGLFMNLLAGTHTIVIQDDSLCEQPFLIKLVGPEKLNVIYHVIEPSCLGVANGEIGLEPIGGTPPYSIEFFDSTKNSITEMDKLSSGRYTVLLNDVNSCLFTDTIYLNAPYCDQALIIPNVFSPNGDGENDIFKIKSIYPIQNYSITIHSRWGLKVFGSSDINTGWDGNLKGIECSDGVYYYLIQYFDNSKLQTRKGFLHLFR